MTSVKQPGRAVGLLTLTSGEPECHDAELLGGWRRHREMMVTHVAALVLTARGAAFVRVRTSSIGVARSDIVAGVMRHTAGVSGPARMPLPVVVAVNGGGRGGLACDGRRHHRRGRSAKFIQVSAGSAWCRSRFDLAAAAPDRPPTRARTDASERAAVRRARARMGLVRRVVDDDRCSMSDACHARRGPTRALVATRQLWRKASMRATARSSA